MSSTCFHCDEHIPQGYQSNLVIDGVARAFCCPGCLAVASLIIESKLESYYTHREKPAITPQVLTEIEHNEIDSFSHDELINQFAIDVLDETGEKQLKQITLNIQGMSCAACLWLIEESVSKVRGVHEISVNLMTHKATLIWDNIEVPLSDVLSQIYKIGYKAKPYEPNKEEIVAKAEERAVLKRLVVAGLGMMQVMMFAVGLYAGAFQGIADEYKSYLQMVSMLVATPIVFYSAKPFFQRAYHSVLSCNLGMDVPVSLVIIVAYITSVKNTLSHAGDVYFDTIAMFVFFLTLSRYLEMRSRHNAYAHLQNIHQLIPHTARLLTSINSAVNYQDVLTKNLEVDDEVLVKPGEIIPIDGVISQGHSAINESILSGESQPLQKKERQPVYAGSINIDNAIVVRVKKSSNQTFVSQLSALINKALSEKPKTLLISDKIAKYFTCVILCLAVLVYLYWSQVDKESALIISLTVLIVACPCALSLAMPTALTVATHALAKLGFIITKGDVLSKLPQCTDVLFDKTGTLTTGKFEIVDCKTYETSKVKCLKIAAMLEESSVHPIALAFRMTRANLNTSTVTNNKIYTGEGVEGIVDGTLYRIGKPQFVAQLYDAPVDIELPSNSNQLDQYVILGDASGPLARFRLKDSINSQAGACMQRLEKQGLAVTIISGDTKEATSRISRLVNVRHYIASARPKDKLAFCQNMQQSNHKVIMVGDGVNDAAVMAGADVSISTHNCINLTKSFSDAHLLNSDLRIIPNAIKHARRTDKIIRFNLIWSLVYNLTAIPLAAMGFVAPYMAAIGMSASSLVVVYNSSRLRSVTMGELD